MINYRLDKVTGVFLPDKETASEVHVVDLAGVDRHGGKGAAEDAALKAVTRVVDALGGLKVARSVPGLQADPADTQVPR